MNILVMGAGGLGGYYGGLLARAGHAVTFVCRGPHLDAVRRQGGLLLKTVHGEFFAPAGATDAPPAGVPADLILFTVKSFETAAAGELIHPAVGPATAILSLQNGVDNEEMLASLYAPDRVLGGVVYMLSTIQSPGVVEQTGGPRTLIFGEWRGGLSDRAQRWEGLMQEAGILATASGDAVREKWVKFAYICAQAGMTALTRLPIGEIRASPPTWAMFRQILEEVVVVGRARGVLLGPEVVENHLALASDVEPHVTSSLYYDLTHGKRLEIEALHGTVVRYGQEVGIPTPACEAVYAALAPHDRLARSTPDYSSRF
jgi:2-dehydropantoate 2-reductase